MRFLITAGPTREPIDPVRFLSNRSSGKMGFALAVAARDAGHEVTLVSGPVALAEPDGVAVLHVTTAADMLEAVASEISEADVAIFSAAVADFRPVRSEPNKIKKCGATLTLELERTRDILGSARSDFGFGGVLVGFAAETERLVENAAAKLRSKRCDLVIANDVSREDIGFDSSDNAVVVCYPGGATRALEKRSKADLAHWIVSECERLASLRAPRFP
jgi:phosphopantothenoylcysteine synthetase/decarboxylase